MKISVEIDEEEFDGDYGPVSGLRLTCSRCRHDVEVFGTGESSALRGAAMLRAECPRGENNYYDTDGWV